MTNRSAAVIYDKKYTYADYLVINENTRCEIIDGVLQ